jgi:hypothetical protein
VNCSEEGGNRVKGEGEVETEAERKADRGGWCLNKGSGQRQEGGWEVTRWS